MFKRSAAYFALIFLFAFAQIGAAAHEISHLKDYSHQTLPDKNTVVEQCAQCVAYAEVASGLVTQTFALEVVELALINATHHHFSYYSNLQSAYQARAPPQHNRI